MGYMKQSETKKDDDEVSMGARGCLIPICGEWMCVWHGLLSISVAFLVVWDAWMGLWDT